MALLRQRLYELRVKRHEWEPEYGFGADGTLRRADSVAPPQSMSQIAERRIAGIQVLQTVKEVR